jgi:hypothetical protein
MKIIAALLATLSITTAWAHPGNQPLLSSDRISNFVSGGLTPTNLQRMAPAGQSVRLPFGSLSNLSTLQNSSGVQLSGGDFSSLFSQLSAINGHSMTDFMNGLHFDPALLAKIQMFVQSHNFDKHSLGDFQSFVGDLHFDPALLAKVQTFLQGHNFDNLSPADVKSFIDSLHLDPALVAKLDAFLQDFHHGDCGNGDNDNDNDNDQEGEDNDDDEGMVQVPEPGTFGLIFAGAALLGGTLIRRRVR